MTGCPLCGNTDASAIRIATMKRGRPTGVQVVECADCGVFVLHDDSLSGGPLAPDALRRLRHLIRRGSTENTPADVTWDVVASARHAGEARRG